ncbi:MAG: SseB family protein [Firmicutes bacterium]|nr:SseB family protein [Bacillota bacterium]
MEFNKAVSNPMLVGCIELLKAEDTPEHRNMFVAELTKSLLQAPAIIDPEPVADAEGRLSVKPGSRVQFPMLATPEGKRFFMGFTDAGEYRKWVEKNKELPTFSLKFDDYANMLLRRDPQGNECPAYGFVINPMGANVIVPKEMVAGMMAARVAQARQMAAKKQGMPMPPKQPE